MIQFNGNRFIGLAHTFTRAFGREIPLLGFTPDTELADVRAALEARRDGRALRLSGVNKRQPRPLWAQPVSQTYRDNLASAMAFMQSIQPGLDVLAKHHNGVDEWLKRGLNNPHIVRDGI